MMVKEAVTQELYQWSKMLPDTDFGDCEANLGGLVWRYLCCATTAWSVYVFCDACLKDGYSWMTSVNGFLSHCKNNCVNPCASGDRNSR